MTSGREAKLRLQPLAHVNHMPLHTMLTVCIKAMLFMLVANLTAACSACTPEQGFARLGKGTFGLALS